MRKIIIQYAKAIFPFAAGLSAFINTAYSQQHVIADKNNTHPEVTNQQYMPAKIILFSAVPMDGFNEIEWSAVDEQDTRKYILEYSMDGINFRTAGETSPFTGTYKLKHITHDTRTLFYRLRMEKRDGKFVNTAIYLLEGTEIPPVKIYPTMIEGNTINLQTGLPLERINVFSSDGRQVFVKEMGGFTGSTQIVIPSLGKGTYWVSFYGSDWKSNSKFIVGR